MFFKKLKNKKNENKIVELGYVYLIKMNIDYKIGISKQPQKRLVEFTKLARVKLPDKEPRFPLASPLLANKYSVHM